MDFRKIKAVIFDFDGVIADTAADIARSTNAALEHFGYRTLSQEQIILFVGGGADQLLRRSIDASLELSPPAMLTGQPPFGEVYEWYVNYYRQHCVEGTELYPGVQSLLELLCIQEPSSPTSPTKLPTPSWAGWGCTSTLPPSSGQSRPATSSRIQRGCFWPFDTSTRDE